MKTNIVLIVCAAAVTLVGTTDVMAAPHSDSTAVAMDALVGRPLGFAATIAGSAVFLVTLPFSATSGSIKSTAEALVLRPGRDTFVRPIGDFEYHHHRTNQKDMAEKRNNKKEQS